MISQMHAVQNAARMAMDHRAADPRRRRGIVRGSRGRGLVAWIAAILALAASALLLAS